MTYGEPSGIVREAALGLAWDVAQRPWQPRDAIVRAMEHAVGQGLTGVHPNDAASYAIYKVMLWSVDDCCAVLRCAVLCCVVLYCARVVRVAHPQAPCVRPCRN